MTMMAGTMATTGANNLWYRGESLIAFGPEHAANVAAGGFSTQAAKRYIPQHAFITLGKFSPDNIEGRYRVRRPDLYSYADLDTRAPAAEFAEDLLTVVMGGAGKYSMFVPSFGPTRTMTRALILPDGQPAKSVQDFRGR